MAVLRADMGGVSESVQSGCMHVCKEGSASAALHSAVFLLLVSYTAIS